MHPNYVPFSDLDTDPVANAVTSNAPLAAVRAPPFSFIEYTERQEKLDNAGANAADAVLFEEDLVEEVEKLPFVSVRFGDIDEVSACDEAGWNKMQASI